jgi:hypothetical protein
MSENPFSPRSANGGDVVLLKGAQSEELVPAVVRRPVDEALVVIPLSAGVERATEWDLLLPRDLLGYDAIAQVWGFGSVLEEQVDEVLTSLRDLELGQLNCLISAMREGKPPPKGVPVGPEVISDGDPRLLAQAEEAEWLHQLWEPALALAGAATLGQLVAHRRSAFELASDEIALAGHDEIAWLEDLEADRLDIPNMLKPAELAELLVQLRIQASKRLGRITLWTIEAAAPGLARGASGKGSATNAKGYVEEMLNWMEDSQQ